MDQELLTELPVSCIWRQQHCSAWYEKCDVKSKIWVRQSICIYL